MGTFDGRVALVTGAASGIGRALALELARRGARVVLADRDTERLSLAVDEVAAQEKSGGADGVDLDVTDAVAFAGAVKDAAQRHGRLDYLFNNAGVAMYGEVRDCSLDDWWRILDINLRGVIHGVQAAYPLMIRQGSGHIVNTASIAGLCAAPGMAPYAASKHAVVGLSSTLRAEGRAFGVRCSAICPSVIRTPIMESMKIIGEDRVVGGRQGLYDGMKIPTIPPQRCAQVAVRGVERNKAIIIVGGPAHFMWALQRISPALMVWLTTLVAERTRTLFRPESQA